MKRVWMLASAFLVGCMWGGMAELIDGEEVVHKVKAKPHSCACRPTDDEEARQYARCNADGTHNDNGTHYCCPECGKVCGRMFNEEAKPTREVPPVMPISPPCSSVAEHIAGCGSGTGRCTKCGHPCPNGPPIE